MDTMRAARAFLRSPRADRASTPRGRQMALMLRYRRATGRLHAETQRARADALFPPLDPTVPPLHLVKTLGS